MDAEKNADLYQRVAKASNIMWSVGAGAGSESWATGILFAETREAKEQHTLWCERVAQEEVERHALKKRTRRTKKAK